MTTTTDTPSIALAANPDLAALILRLSNAVLFLIHGGVKLFVFGLAGTAGFFVSLGLPGPLAYVIIALEIVGAIALALGTWTRLFAALLAADLVGAIATVHIHHGFMFANKGGGWEYPAYWAITLVVLILLGPGRYALGKRG